jgi:hypothetical protein
VASLRPAWLSSATGRCDLAQQQEYLDRGVNDYVSTYNPDYAGVVDDTLVAVRAPLWRRAAIVTRPAGRTFHARFSARSERGRVEAA